MQFQGTRKILRKKDFVVQATTSQAIVCKSTTLLAFVRINYVSEIMTCGKTWTGLVKGGLDS